MNNKFDELAKGSIQTIARTGVLRKFGVVGFALACFGLTCRAQAGGPTYTTIDFPGAGFTAATDINKSGQIIGWYVDSTGNHGFLLNGGSPTSITFPGAAGTAALGINQNGDIVGEYNTSKDWHGFLLHGGAFTSIDYPGADTTFTTGINQAGDIVGIYSNPNQAGKNHGFLLRGGVFTTIDFPGASLTEPWKINDSGEIVGRYVGTTNDKSHIFRFANGVFVSVGDFPGAVLTAPSGFTAHHGGLNNAGDIVNGYSTATPENNTGNDNVLSNTHGFVLSSGVYTSIDFPGSAGTIGYGINDLGAIVGGYVDAAEQVHGYLRTP